MKPLLMQAGIFHSHDLHQHPKQGAYLHALPCPANATFAAFRMSGMGFIGSLIILRVAPSRLIDPACLRLVRALYDCCIPQGPAGWSFVPPNLCQGLRDEQDFITTGQADWLRQGKSPSFILSVQIEQIERNSILGVLAYTVHQQGVTSKIMPPKMHPITRNALAMLDKW